MSTKISRRWTRSACHVRSINNQLQSLPCHPHNSYPASMHQRTPLDETSKLVFGQWWSSECYHWSRWFVRGGVWCHFLQHPQLFSNAWDIRPAAWRSTIVRHSFDSHQWVIALMLDRFDGQGSFRTGLNTMALPFIFCPSLAVLLIQASWFLVIFKSSNLHLNTALS